MPTPPCRRPSRRRGSDHSRPRQPPAPRRGPVRSESLSALASWKPPGLGERTTECRFWHSHQDHVCYLTLPFLELSASVKNDEREHSRGADEGLAPPSNWLRHLQHVPCPLLPEMLQRYALP